MMVFVQGFRPIFRRSRRMFLWLIFISILMTCRVAIYFNQKDKAEASRSSIQGKFSVETSSSGRYKVQVQGQTWLTGAPTFFRSDNQVFSTADGSLKLTDSPHTVQGSDVLGTWSLVNFSYVLEGVKQHRVNVQVKSYHKLPVVRMSQVFVDGVDSASTGDANKVISAFPAFNVEDRGMMGLLVYSGIHIWDNTRVVRWKKGMKRVKDGLDGGPVVLFDNKGQALVISPFNQFMSASFWHDNSSDIFNWGIMGKVDHIPRFFQYDTILYFSDKGINQAMSGWGQVMRQWYGKEPSWRLQDPSVKYLGYYTDNGGYYYQFPEPGMDYEQTLISVNKYAHQKHIPYRYLQYDDWWYVITGSGYGAAVTWEPKPGVFPHGMRYLYNKTRQPVVAHNRYWSNTTTYATHNGGPFKFLIRGDLALPLEKAFWEYLFSTAVQWGLAVYEQDWLNYQVNHIAHTDVYLGRKWLTEMGEAASRYGLRIQYCMPQPRHALQSLEIPVVTQIRVSTDYTLLEDQWKIGITSMFADAMGLAPFKDNFWTMSKQPGNPYKNRTEPCPFLQAVVAVLSMGPVAPSDRIGYSDHRLIEKISTVDGLILKPSKPATAVDAQVMKMALGSSFAGPQGEVRTTYSKISDYYFGIIFAAEMKSSWAIGPSLAGFTQFASSFVWSYKYSPDTDRPVPFTDDALLQLKGCTYVNFCLYYTSPLIHWRKKPILLLGEKSKIVPMSPQRVASIEISDNDLQITLTGTPQEEVEFYIYMDEQNVSFECRIGYLGTAMISLAQSKCLSYSSGLRSDTSLKHS